MPPRLDVELPMEARALNAPIILCFCLKLNSCLSGSLPAAKFRIRMCVCVCVCVHMHTVHHTPVKSCLLNLLLLPPPRES